MDQKIIKILENRGVGVLPTDTLYGLVGSALSKKAVDKIYKLKNRNSRKPLIILIGSMADLKMFKIRINAATKKLLLKLWPGKISVILPCPDRKFFYLHRGTKTLAFRFPKKPSLIKLLKKTGPLVAPSANFEDLPPAKNIGKAKKYFGDKIDFYINGGVLKSRSSTIVELRNNKLAVKRAGAVEIIK